MRSLLIVSLALVPPFVTALWMRVQLSLAENDLGPVPASGRLPLGAWDPAQARADSSMTCHTSTQGVSP